MNKIGLLFIIDGHHRKEKNILPYIKSNVIACWYYRLSIIQYGITPHYKGE